MTGYENIDGIEWHYRVEGDGDPLLFLHGWSVDMRIWRQQVKHFSDDYRVITVDLPGHGKSGWRPVTLDDLGKGLNTLLSSLDFWQGNIVASSMGGMVAMKLWGIDPSKMRRLTLVGSLPKFVNDNGYDVALDHKHVEKLRSQLDSDYPAIVNIFFRSLFTRQERESRRFQWMQRFRQNIEVPSKDALQHYLDILMTEDLRGVVPTIRIPVQTVNGTEDYICAREAVEFYRSNTSSLRVDFFEKCGHFPFLSKPYEFNQAVGEFLCSR